MRNVWSTAFTLAIVLGIGAIVAIQSVKAAFTGPGPAAADAEVDVPVGASLTQIARDLEDDGVITSAWLFTAAGSYLGVAGSLKAGSYAVPAGASMQEVLNLITEGRAIQSRVTIVEGWSSHQVVEYLRSLDFLDGEIVDVPAEGSVAPNTYFVQKGADRSEILQTMIDAQSALLAELWRTRAPDLPIKTPEEALILASIVEKETGVAGERALVASVFVNRLRRPMRLQSDPTIIYGITKGERVLGRGLRRSEIDQKTPYNTYQIDGLPPTPIANPGRDAIAAVLNPAKTDYLYFVAQGGGSHAFAKTLREHNANVANWRKIERARRRAAEEAQNAQ